jgi:zeaxanthin glucosyltransferase
MKLGFICLDIPGHINPMTALARTLQARGHDVIFLYSRGGAGLPFVPNEQKDHFNDNRSQISTMYGKEALRFAMHGLVAQSEAMLTSLRRMVEATGVDALVLDRVQFYLELGPMQLGIPYIHVSNALHFDFTGYTPLSVYDWPHEMNSKALARNREGVTEFSNMIRDGNQGVRAYAKSAGLDIDWENPDSTLSPLASISQTPGAFDFESSHWPAQFHHTGPFHDGKGRPEVDFPWERLTGEPLIYASMGTLQNGMLDVFRVIASAAAKYEDFQLVVSIGEQLDPKQIGTARGNAIVVKQAPQLELLKRASVCITHAGLNTALEALAQGVPQVAIPVTYDQPGVAARIAHKKTGVVTSLNKLTVDHVSTLLNEVLSQSSYRNNARELQKMIANTHGLSVAADIVEKVLGVTRNCEFRNCQ